MIILFKRFRKIFHKYTGKVLEKGIILRTPGGLLTRTQLISCHCQIRYFGAGFRMVYFPCRATSHAYPPDNTGMMTIEFPSSIKLSKLPTFSSMRIMTLSSGKGEGKIFLNGVGLSKTKFFVRAPTTSAR